MPETRVRRQHYTDRMRTDFVPIAELECGVPIVVETNPSSRIATGPMLVEGAEPGDALAIAFHRVEIVGDEGAMWAIPERGLLGHHVGHLVNKKVPIREGRAWFNDRIALPLRPMVGVVGVAPKPIAWPEWPPLSHVVGTSPKSGEVFTAWPSQSGGNLDCKEIVAGATVYLPVGAPGAGLCIGDIHAVMGDGELMLSGIETLGEVEIVLSLRKGRAPRGPIVENDTHFMVVGIGKTLEAAAEDATEHMAAILQQRLGLDLLEAGMLLSAAGDLAICQVVNAYPTVRLVVDKRVIPDLEV